MCFSVNEVGFKLETWKQKPSETVDVCGRCGVRSYKGSSPFVGEVRLAVIMRLREQAIRSYRTSGWDYCVVNMGKLSAKICVPFGAQTMEYAEFLVTHNTPQTCLNPFSAIYH